jgi:lipid A 4'-phosphatase
MIKNKQLKKDILFYIVIFGTLTLPFLFTNLDIRLQEFFFDSDKGFYMRSIPFWDIIYKYGIFPGYLFAVGAIFLFTYTYWKPALIGMRRWALMMILTIVLGPGLLVNATFKDNWGRPRPNEIVEFGGKEKFIKPWVKGDSGGKSFPCGHASMGFFFSIPFLFLRKKYKKLAWSLMIFGILYGTLVGVARMIAGGHFASDVVWSAGLVWFAALIAYYALNVDKEVIYKPADSLKQKKKARTMTIIMGVILPLLIITALLATPYLSKKQFNWSVEELMSIGMNYQSVDFNEGNIDIKFGNEQQINYEVAGFGFPNSKIRAKWVEGDTTKYWLERLGWFTEVRNQIHIILPENTAWINHVSVNEGNIFVHIPENAPLSKLKVEVGEGDLTIYAKNVTPFTLISGESLIKNEAGIEYLTASVDSVFQLKVAVDEGELIILQAD